jgi:poly-gamma-glutamate synthesis protein (capsule biosynthesis protein)
MNKKNLLIFAVTGILSLILLTGIVIYSFRLQEQEDRLKQSAGSPEQLAAAADDNPETQLLEDASASNVQDSGQTSASAVQGSGQSSASGSVLPDSTGTMSEKTPGEAPDSDASPSGSNSEAGTDELPVSGEADAVNPTDAAASGSSKVSQEPIVLAFVGDINLDESSKPVSKYDGEGKGILGCISPELVEEMNAADLMMLNNEFSYSLRGTPAEDKSYTFRANPERVNILKEMGVDIVSLANNHALDYGMDALEDTFATLEDAGIDYIGAGDTLDRAKAPVYYNIGGKKIAYLAASRVVFAMDWYATDTQPGMIGTYDPSLLLDQIREADKSSDFVVVYVHWGVERTNYPTDYQKSLARQYIDAGADAVIGCHPHVLQGLEFYKGKPIAYSLGNYWFNNTTREAGLLKIYLNADGSTKVKLLPTMGKDTYTYLLENAADREAYFDFMKEISFGVDFDEDGYVTEVKSASAE